MKYPKHRYSNTIKQQYKLVGSRIYFDQKPVSQ